VSRKDRKKRARKQERRQRKKVEIDLAPAPYAGRPVPLQKIDDQRWRVPRTGGMHVDGVVFADEAILPDLKEDRSLEQVANVATLPGIVGHSLAMPDIHWGYGFPIGGVAAFDPERGGVVSPGGVGYDINCLHGDTPILHAHGYTRPIRQVVAERLGGPVVLLDPDAGALAAADVVAGLAQAPSRPVFELETDSGRTIVATEDHPFFTPDGMRDAGTLGVGDQVATVAFEGVPYAPPASAEVAPDATAPDGRPLTFDHPALPELLAVAGAALGAGGSNAGRRELPGWIERAPRWQQRLLLSSLCDAALDAPCPLRGGRFAPPELRLGDARLARGVARLLAGFGVDCAVRGGGRVVVDDDPESLIALWTRVGWARATARGARGLVAAAYLRLARAPSLVGTGGRGRPEGPAPSFEVWRVEATRGLGDSGAVWERVVAVRPRADVERVYDITVDHPAHDFVANGFVVHNCGVRLLTADVDWEEAERKVRPLTEGLFRAIPAGVGSRRKDLQLGDADLDGLMADGLGWAVAKGLASEHDRLHVEEEGRIAGAEPGFVSERARKRGGAQVGTLGSGNHFAEVGVVEEVYDAESAAAFGLRLGQVTLMIHSGSRGLGHQVCTESLGVMLRAAQRYRIPLVDRQLCCAPIESEEAVRYLGAMAAAANFAFVNRQVMAHWAREVFADVLGAELTTVYDVCHNIAKWESHAVEGAGDAERRLLVHRKGATRALPRGHPLLPPSYREIGQPVIIPGDMGRYSYVLKGAAGSRRSFGSACHGAGRLLSRSEAKRRYGRQDITAQLAAKGIIVIGASKATVVEEVPEAYKDVAEVVHVVHDGGLAEQVARIRPVGCVKG